MTYLQARGLDPTVVDFLTSHKANENVFIPFSVKRDDYAIHHFLDGSHRAGYGAKNTNGQLNTDGTDYVAVALVEGDDVVCINVKDGSVHLWLIQNNNGEMIKIAESFTEFLKISTKMESGSLD